MERRSEVAWKRRIEPARCCEMIAVEGFWGGIEPACSLLQISLQVGEKSFSSLLVQHIHIRVRL